MVALVVGASLFMVHIATPQTGPSGQSAQSGNFFKFDPFASKPHRVALDAAAATPAPSPSAAPSLAPTPNPTYEERLAERKKLALAAKEHLVKATPSTVALVNSTTQSDVPGTPGGPAVHVRPFTPTTLVPLVVQPLPAATAQPAPAATAAQVASAPQQQASVYSPGTILDARFITRQEPAYPEMAREQDARGTATVLVTIGPRGNVLSARVSQSTGFQMLDNAALEAAHGSTFQPPLIDGKPATATYRITYDFAP
jgi:protein TonB